MNKSIKHKGKKIETEEYDFIEWTLGELNSIEIMVREVLESVSNKKIIYKNAMKAANRRKVEFVMLLPADVHDGEDAVLDIMERPL